MKHQPLQIARWALGISLAMMLAIVGLSNPSPSAAWKIAQEKRHQQRFPHLRPTEIPLQKPAPQMAEQSEQTPEAEKTAAPSPFRTAQLPTPSGRGDRASAGARLQEPEFFFEEKPAAK